MNPQLPLTCCIPVGPEVPPYLTKVVCPAMVIGFEYGVAVYLLGSASLTVAFRKNQVLAEVFGYKANDRESMGKGTEYIACIPLSLW